MTVNGRLELPRLEKSSEELPVPQSLNRMDKVLTILLACVLFAMIIQMSVLSSHVDLMMEEVRGWQKKATASAITEAEQAKTAERAREAYIEQQSRLIAQQRMLKDLLDQNAMKVEEINRKLKGMP